MNRRKFIRQTVVASSTTAITFSALIGSAASKIGNPKFKRVDATFNGEPLNYPSDKRVPLGYRVFSVPLEENQDTILTFKNLPRKNIYTHAWLRITAAIDFRELKAVRAYLPKSNRELGIFKMIYAHPFQPFEIPIDINVMSSIDNEGIALQLVEGESSAWFYAGEGMSDRGLNAYLLFANATSGRLDAFQKNLYSMNSFGPFGWIGGCVLDALWERHLTGDKKALTVLKSHLGHVLHANLGVKFENPRTQPMDGTFNSIEDFLPMVPIAGLYPNHISVDNALKYLNSKKDENGLIYQGHITTEGCYTVAYPLAFIAAIRKDKNLAQLAMDQLILRKEMLQDGTNIYQRATSSGEKSYKNWGRGVAWYLLGMVKTIKVLRENKMVDAKKEIEILATIESLIPQMVAQQSKEGMWYAYIDQPATKPDTSTTAGIATAIAHSVQMGIFPKEMLSRSEHAFLALQEYLAPDGWLQGMTQINRGGEDLQAGGYRVMSHFGLGLMAQLKTVLDLKND